MLDFILFFPSFSIQSINNSSANIDHPCHLRFASSTVQNFGVLFSISLSVWAFHVLSFFYVLFEMCLKMCFLSIFFLSMCFLCHFLLFVSSFSRPQRCNSVSRQTWDAADRLFGNDKSLHRIVLWMPL